MYEVLDRLTPADYAFLVGLIESDVNLTNTAKLRRLLADVEAHETAETRAALNRQLKHEIRYLGSSDIAYLFRYATGREPGVSFREIIRDVARVLKVEVPVLGTEREMLEGLVQEYATRQFASLTPEQQQEMLESLGVERERAAAFIKKSAGVFAVPALIQAFGSLVVNGLIKTVIFGTIARVVGKQLAMCLFDALVARFPWWVSWIGPVSWTLSISWTVVDLQGPAYRKTIPIVLYLGLCSLRDRENEGGERRTDE